MGHSRKPKWQKQSNRKVFFCLVTVVLCVTVALSLFSFNETSVVEELESPVVVDSVSADTIAEPAPTPVLGTNAHSDTAPDNVSDIEVTKTESEPTAVPSSVKSQPKNDAAKKSASKSTTATVVKRKGYKPTHKFTVSVKEEWANSALHFVDDWNSGKAVEVLRQMGIEYPIDIGSANAVQKHNDSAAVDALTEERKNETNTIEKDAANGNGNDNAPRSKRWLEYYHWLQLRKSAISSSLPSDSQFRSDSSMDSTTTLHKLPNGLVMKLVSDKSKSIEDIALSLDFEEEEENESGHNMSAIDSGKSEELFTTTKFKTEFDSENELLSDEMAFDGSPDFAWFQWSAPKYSAVCSPHNLPHLYRFNYFPTAVALQSLSMNRGTAVWVMLALTIGHPFRVDPLKHLYHGTVLKMEKKRKANGKNKKVAIKTNATASLTWQKLSELEDGLRDSLTGARFLCVFNDGTRILSRPVITKLRRVVVVCDMNDKRNENYYKNAGKLQWFNDWKQTTARRILDSKLRTTVGVKLFDTRLISNKLDPFLGLKHDLMHPASRFQWMPPSAVVPVCSTMAVNRGELHRSDFAFDNVKNMLQNFNVRTQVIEAVDDVMDDLNSSRAQYSAVDSTLTTTESTEKARDVFADAPKGKTVGYNRNKANRSSSEVQSLAKKALEFEGVLFPPRSGRKVQIAACALAHPKADRDAKRADILLRQWLEFHKLEGFGHFYIYDHLSSESWTAPRKERDKVWDAISDLVVRKGIATYIPWAVASRRASRVARLFQMAQMNDCIRRFRGEARFVALIDCDEWLMPNPWFEFSNAGAVKLSNDLRTKVDNAWRKPSFSVANAVALAKSVVKNAPVAFWIRRHNGIMCPQKHVAVATVVDKHLRTDAPNCSSSGIVDSDSLQKQFEDYCDAFPRILQKNKQFWNEYQMGFDCQNEVYGSYLARHRCVSMWDPYAKLIVDPSTVWDMFVHRVALFQGKKAQYFGAEERKYVPKNLKKKPWPNLIENLHKEPFFILHTSDHSYSPCVGDNPFNTGPKLRTHILRDALQFDFLNRKIARFEEHWAAGGFEALRLRPVVDDSANYCLLKDIPLAHGCNVTRVLQAKH